jgi:hypothetical protein
MTHFDKIRKILHLLNEWTTLAEAGPFTEKSLNMFDKNNFSILTKEELELVEKILVLTN